MWLAHCRWRSLQQLLEGGCRCLDSRVLGAAFGGNGDCVQLICPYAVTQRLLETPVSEEVKHLSERDVPQAASAIDDEYTAKSVNNLYIQLVTDETSSDSKVPLIETLAKYGLDQYPSTKVHSLGMKNTGCANGYGLPLRSHSPLSLGLLLHKHSPLSPGENGDSVQLMYLYRVTQRLLEAPVSDEVKNLSERDEPQAASAIDDEYIARSENSLYIQLVPNETSSDLKVPLIETVAKYGLGQYPSTKVHSLGMRNSGLANGCGLPLRRHAPLSHGYRYFSSKTDSVQTRVFKVQTGDPAFLLQKIEAAANEMAIMLDTNALKIEFDRDYRPLLVSNFLLLPCPFDHEATAYLFHLSYSLSGRRKPLCLSSLDVMIRMRLLETKDERKRFMDHLISHRVLVGDNMEKTYGNIEVVRYDPDPPHGDPSFFRCESDASFDEATSLAKVSFIIWKDRQVICSKVYNGVKCRNSAMVEVIAALAGLLKCLEFTDIKKLEFWTDSQRVKGIITGEQVIKSDDPDYGKLLLLKMLQLKFEQFVSFLKPREVMFLSDQLMRPGDFPVDCFIEKALEKWSYALNRGPLFRITLNSVSRELEKGFGEKVKNYKVETTFFMKVEKDDKARCIVEIKETLRPERFYLVINSAYEHKIKELNLFSNIDTFTVGETCTTYGFKRKLPSVPKQRKLVIVWDAKVPYNEYFRDDACIIILVEENEVDIVKQRGLSEVSALSYAYFQREELRAKEDGGGGGGKNTKKGQKGPTK